MLDDEDDVTERRPLPPLPSFPSRRGHAPWGRAGGLRLDAQPEPTRQTSEDEFDDVADEKKEADASLDNVLDDEQREDLVSQLTAARAHISKTAADRPKPHMIASTEAIAHMARELPMSLADLSNTPTFGSAQVRKYGGDFLQCIWAFLQLQRIALPPHKLRAREEHVSALAGKQSQPQPVDAMQTVDLTMTQSSDTDATAVQPLPALRPPAAEARRGHGRHVGGGSVRRGWCRARLGVRGRCGECGGWEERQERVGRQQSGGS